MPRSKTHNVVFSSRVLWRIHSKYGVFLCSHFPRVVIWWEIVLCSMPLEVFGLSPQLCFWGSMLMAGMKWVLMSSVSVHVTLQDALWCTFEIDYDSVMWLFVVVVVVVVVAVVVAVVVVVVVVAVAAVAVVGVVVAVLVVFAVLLLLCCCCYCCCRCCCCCCCCICIACISCIHVFGFLCLILFAPFAHLFHVLHLISFVPEDAVFPNLTIRIWCRWRCQRLRQLGQQKQGPPRWLCHFWCFETIAATWPDES